MSQPQALVDHLAKVRDMRRRGELRLSRRKKTGEKKPVPEAKEPAPPRALTRPATATGPCIWTCLGEAHRRTPSQVKVHYDNVGTCPCGVRAPWNTAERAAAKKAALEKQRALTEPPTASGPCSWMCLNPRHATKMPNFSTDRKCYYCSQPAPWEK